MIIGLFGISGSGKTFTTSALSNKRNDIITFRASQIIAKYRDTIDYKLLSETVVDENQRFLIEGLKLIKAEYPNKVIIIELHNIIETPTGPIKVGVDVFKQLNIDKSFFLKIESKDLYAQRVQDTSRNRPIKPESVLLDFQNMSLDYFDEIFTKLAIPHQIIEKHHLDILKRVI